MKQLFLKKNLETKEQCSFSGVGIELVSQNLTSISQEMVMILPVSYTHLDVYKRQIVNHIKEKLGIKAGETTADGLFTLKPAECLGACGYAPMMQLGKFYKENLTIEKVDEILELCRQGQVALD